jgi:hypothetical protein
VKFALRERFGGDKTVFQTDLPQPRCHAAIVAARNGERSSTSKSLLS